ncbi:tetratricopeptide repeat protein [Algoriphagus halophilus]|uniref:tetratricopeptide repeat protein n=1 Tax=Algoriphagus halophilus TaxID=226505 RepID=UPI00358E3D01
MYVKKREIFEAIHYFKKALNLNKQSPNYWVGLADAEFNLGNLQASSEAYEEAINLEPGILETYINLSLIYFDQNRFEEAVDVISEGIDELPEEAELYYRMVVFQIKLANYKEAFSYLENALTLAYDRHVVLYELMPELEKQKAMSKIIAQYREENPET